ncbi:MAG TPA: kelch repeat-containing protein, partial [Acidimicrobiales bacterium]|nr:kelch repeat-containing protein [Acidimicrobiales bacterium]
AASGQVILFGGLDASGNTLADTWTYNGTTWSAPDPPPHSDTAMAYDSATGQTVLFGGLDANGATLADTWTYNGTTWTQQTPAKKPEVRSDASMTYDAAMGQTVLFGGLNRAGTAGRSTWTYNGTTWTKQSPATSPPAHSDASMAYDAATRQVVLFGGLDASGNSLADTWTYNGTTWTKQSPATSPPARAYASMTYDAGGGQVVLFGGLDASGNTLGDTWTYNGTTWTQQSPAASPPARSDASMIYDAASGQVILFGGLDASGNTLGDTWTRPDYLLGQAVAFTSVAPASAMVGGPTYAVAATGGVSGNPVTFYSVTPLVCTLSGSTVSFVGAGTCTIDADQAGTNTAYSAAPTSTQSFSVSKAAAPSATTTTLTLSSPVSFGAENQADPIVKVVSSDGSIPLGAVNVTHGTKTLCTVTLGASGTGTCTFSGTALAPGNFALRATYAPANASFRISRSASNVLVVNRTSTALAVTAVTVYQTASSWSVAFSATLTSPSTGQGVSGRTVRFTLNGSGRHRCTATTNAVGVGMCSVLGKGQFSLTGATGYSAAFRQTGDYSASSSAAAVDP